MDKFKNRLSIRKKPVEQPQQPVINPYEQRAAEAEAEKQALKQKLEQWESHEFMRKEQERQERIRVQKEREHQEFIRQQEALKEEEHENQLLNQRRQASSQALRRLRGLIRERYRLDTDIWSMKATREVNHPIVFEKMKKADAVMDEIRNMVELWDPTYFSPDEWKVARKIKDSLLMNDKRKWANNPPWYDRG